MNNTKVKSSKCGIAMRRFLMASLFLGLLFCGVGCSSHSEQKDLEEVSGIESSNEDSQDSQNTEKSSSTKRITLTQYYLQYLYKEQKQCLAEDELNREEAFKEFFSWNKMQGRDLRYLDSSEGRNSYILTSFEVNGKAKDNLNKLESLLNEHGWKFLSKEEDGGISFSKNDGSFQSCLLDCFDFEDSCVVLIQAYGFRDK